MSFETSLTPSAQGSLSKTPLAHLLVYLAEKQLSGSLVLRGDDGSESVVYFATGAPAKIRTSYSGKQLGAVLLQLGLVAEEALKRSEPAIKRGEMLHGQILLGMNAIDEAQLVAGLREQCLRRMLKLFEKLRDPSVYAFYSQVNLLQDWAGPELTPLDPIRVLWEGLHLRQNDKNLDPTIARIGQGVLRLRSPELVRRFGFGPDEMKVVELLRVKPMAFQQLLEMRSGAVRATKLLVYALLITKTIEVQADVAVSVSESSMPAQRGAGPATDGSPPPGQVVTSARALPHPSMRLKKPASAADVKPPVQQAPPVKFERDEITRRAATIEGEDFFEVLGIAQTDPPDVVRSVFFSLAKKWHPDRLPEELKDLRDSAAKVFAKISEAHQTLSDPERRRQYLELMQKSVDTNEEEKVQKVIAATIDFQKAEVFARRKEFDKALKFAQRAYLGDPEQADHIALYAWMLAQSPERAEKKNFEESLQLLTRAIKQEERCEKAFFYRAQLLKLQGRHKSALKDFRSAAELNPRNLDALREIRLAEMRGSIVDDPKPVPEPKAKNKGDTSAPIDWGQDDVGAIVGKLFKRK